MEGVPGNGRTVGDYMLLQKIGSGSFADVWKAQHRVTTDVVAIKEIATDRLNRRLRQSLESEVSILRRISHRNIVQLYTVIEIRSTLFLVMEYCAGGDLSGFIRKHRRISETDARPLLQQLAAGLKELWSHHLVHRDLKPQNLLLSSTGPDAILKIADFGFARDLQPQGLAETLCGSPLYMAPEILKFYKYDSKADLWSVGTVLYELVVGRPPFNGINHVQLLHNIERSEARIPPDVLPRLSAHLVALISQLLKRNPLERISFEEFFDHPFLLPLGSGSSPPSPQSSTVALSHPGLAASPTTLMDSAQPLQDRQGSIGSGPPRHPGQAQVGAALRGPWDAQSGPAEALPFLLEPLEGRREPARVHIAAVDPAALASEVPTARFVAPPTVMLRSSEGAKGDRDLRSSGSSMRSAQIVQPMMDSLVEEDDYVFVDAAPSPSSSSQASRSSSVHRSGSATPANMPPIHRGVSHARGGLTAQPAQAALQQAARPPDPQPALARAGASAPQALAFTLGVSRIEALRKVARLLDSGLPDHSRPEGRSGPGAALVLRILALQVLHAAVELCRRDPTAAGNPTDSLAAVDLITADMRGIVQHADEAAAAAAAMGQSAGGLPDVWELVFRAALSLARSAAVDELLGATTACLRAYSRAAALFYFMFAEAPNLPLTPPLVLSPADVYRLQKYTRLIACRYQAAASAAASPAAAVPTLPQPAHSQRGVSS